jgi:thymidylate synthase (FAD)
MLLIKPKYEILSISSDLTLMEKVGRVCYLSEPQGEPEKFLSKRIKEGHETIIEHSSMTVKFTVDRGFTHELVRHRLVTYSQESTRWCDYSGGVTFIIPPWVNIPEDEYIIDDAVASWYGAMIDAENRYKFLLAQNWSPQQARTVLPNSLKTTIVATTNFRQWRLIFKQRAIGTTGRPHPQMLEIMVPLLEEVKQKVPAIFDDLIVKREGGIGNAR